jgi:hypothetical protein
MNIQATRFTLKVIDGWPILVAFASYWVAFGVFSMTTASAIPVA